MAETFSGDWDDDEGLVVRVEGALGHGAPHVASMRMPDGSLLDLSVLSQSTCSFESGGDVYTGTLSDDGSSIAWSDGGSWLRKAAAARPAEAPEPPPSAGAIEAKAPPPAKAEGLLGASWAAGRGLLVSAAMGRGGKGSRKGLGKGKGKVLLGKVPGVPAIGGGGAAHGALRPLTLDQAVSLQEELLDAFADEAFQKRLREVERLHGKAYQEVTDAHRELFLEVHRALLPSYGFPGTGEGVRDMLAAAARHNGNQEFWRNRVRLNRLLGLEPPLALCNAGEEPESAAAAAGEAAEPRSVAGATAGRASARAGSAAQKPAGRVRVTARHATDGDTLQVMVPETATFQAVKEAISKKVGRAEFLTKGRLVGQEDDVFVPHKDEGRIGDLREVLVLGFGLQTHEDEEAKAWRHELTRRQKAADQ